MRRHEVYNAVFIDGKTLQWNDPSPIEGNDYTVKKIYSLSDETAYIMYGEGSEAEVFLSELSIKQEA